MERGVASTTRTSSRFSLPQSSEATTPIQYTIPLMRGESPIESITISLVVQSRTYSATGHPSTVVGGWNPEAGSA